MSHLIPNKNERQVNEALKSKHLLIILISLFAFLGTQITAQAGRHIYPKLPASGTTMEPDMPEIDEPAHSPASPPNGNTTQKNKLGKVRSQPTTTNDRRHPCPPECGTGPTFPPPPTLRTGRNPQTGAVIKR